MKLRLLLERSKHKINMPALDRLTKYCFFCQKHGKSPGCFKFTLRDNVNFNLTSQIGYIICLTDTSNKTNIIHWSSIKCKKVTKSVLASKFYAMLQGFDVGAVIKSTTEEILDIKLLPMIVCINSKLLYNCLVKLGSTQEKRLIVDIICLRQLYKRRKIMKIR